jgi:hypothetical protein
LHEAANSKEESHAALCLLWRWCVYNSMLVHIKQKV